MNCRLANILTLLSTLLLLVACSSNSGQQSSVISASSFSNDIANEAVMGKWSRSCALCHINGEAGAPVVGDNEEWQRCLAEGEESSLTRVIEGYASMPPLGYCMSCEESDFRAMIAFMAGTNQ